MAMNIEDVYPGHDIMMAGRFNVAVVGWYYSTVCNLKLSYTLPYVNSYALLSKVSTILYRTIITSGKWSGCMLSSLADPSAPSHDS